jgi:hypothetical protein
VHGGTPAVDGSGHEAHRQPVPDRRPFEHLDVIRFPAAMVGQVDAVAVPTARLGQSDNHSPEFRNVPDVLEGCVAINESDIACRTVVDQFRQRLNPIMNIRQKFSASDRAESNLNLIVGASIRASASTSMFGMTSQSVTLTVPAQRERLSAHISSAVPMLRPGPTSRIAPAAWKPEADSCR